MAARVLSYQDRTCARAQVITEEVTAKLRLISVQVVHVEMADYVSMESSGSPVNVWVVLLVKSARQKIKLVVVHPAVKELVSIL